jgi:mRNA-degrading endonuclease RelE of RelBE toxin-antitoxin system
MAKSSGSTVCPARIDELCVARVGAIRVEAIDREIAIRILNALTRYGDSGQGDTKALGGERLGYSRLRVGDYRVIFAAAPGEITIVRVRHRSDVYR